MAVYDNNNYPYMYLQLEPILLVGSVRGIIDETIRRLCFS
jgi:hypothetical protein